MGQLRQVLEHHQGVGAGGIHLAQEIQGRGGPAAHHRLEEIEDPGPVGQAQHILDVVLLDRAAAQGDRLVQQREPVAHRAVGGPCDQRQRRRRSPRSPPLRAMPVEVGGEASPGLTRRRSKRWQRDSTVTGTLRISVVAKMKITCSGGSSRVFKRPLKAWRESMCTSSMM